MSSLPPGVPQSRPRTGAPTTAGTERERWSDEELSDEDDDPGMFSFLPPSVVPDPPPSTLRPSCQPTANTSTGSYFPTIRTTDAHGTSQPYPSSQPSPTDSSSITGSQPYSPSLDSSLSPAAAYARASMAPTGAEGPRKRGSWAYPESPTYSSGTAPSFEGQGGRERYRAGMPERMKSEGSGLSRETMDKERYGAWEDQARSDTDSAAYGVDMDGDVMRMDDLGGRKRMATTRSEDEKMVMGEGHGEGSFTGLHGLDFDPFEEEEDSPFPEVRASVSNIDDPEMPCLTFRSWFLGLFFTCIVSAVNVFFMFRYPAPIVTPIITQVLSYPCGKLLAWILPATSWRLPRWMTRLGFGDEVSLNPGPFNIKEHTIIIMMANTATAPAFALNFSVASEKFYGIKQGVGFDMLLIITTQMVGFGMAGLSRRFLVWPAALIWPQNLVFCTLLNTLHAEDDDGAEGGITRYRFFGYVIGGAFFWYFLPGYLFQALSAFSFVCWAAPNNAVVNQLFGVSSGLGMSLLTFDWAQIAYIGSPLVVPWWAEVNIFIGFVIAFWFISPIMYYNNVWYSAFLPISTPQVFDRFGSAYNTSRVIDVGTSSLNVTAYQEYSPLYLPITYATVYGLALALSTAAIVHTIIYHGKDIVNQIRKIKIEEDDIHAKLMRHYPEVPDWWYWSYLVLFTGLSITTVAVWDTEMPVWALIIALVIGFIYILPGGFIFAMTSQQITINLIVELMGGYMMPGAPLGNMLFKVYSSQSINLAYTFIQDLKLGHYMKVPPRATFTVQIVSTCLSCILQVGVKQWLIRNVADLCDPYQSAYLTCPVTTVFYSSSIIWGLIGPARQFGIGMMYNPILWWLLVGAVLPIPFWLLSLKYPKSWLKYVNIPVLLAGATYMPPASGINYSSWFLLGFIFQFWMRRRYFRWWSKFNFVLSAGLDAGTVLSGLFIFFTLQLPKGGTLYVDWWGNNVFTKTADWAEVAYRAIPETGFGRTSW